MSRKKKQVEGDNMVRVEPRTHAKLKKLSQVTDKTLSEIIEELIMTVHPEIEEDMRRDEQLRETLNSKLMKREQ